MTNKNICLLASVLLLSLSNGPASATPIFTNYNGYSIINQHNSGGSGFGTAQDTVFTLSIDTFIGELTTYQIGETSPYLSAIYTIYGPGSFSTSVVADYLVGSAPYVNYHAFLNQWLSAGTYTFHNTDSYWAYNAASSGQGFLQVFEGTPAQVPLPGTIWLLASGFAALGYRRAKRQSA